MTGEARDAWNATWRDPLQRGTWSMAEPSVRALAVSLLPARDVRTVLDLGTGIGRHALLFARAGFAVTACDVATVGLDAARAAATAEGIDVRFDAATMTALPYADAAFDYVLAFNVLFYATPDIARRAVAEIHRVLGPDGLLHATMLSRRNIRYGIGTRVAADTFAPKAGDAAGQPHLFCDARGLCALFGGFEPLSLEDREHGRPGEWHWHLVAERRA